MSGQCDSPCKCFQGCASDVVARHRPPHVCTISKHGMDRVNKRGVAKWRLYATHTYTETFVEQLRGGITPRARWTATFKNVNDATSCGNQTSSAPLPTFFTAWCQHSDIFSPVPQGCSGLMPIWINFHFVVFLAMATPAFLIWAIPTLSFATRLNASVKELVMANWGLADDTSGVLSCQSSIWDVSHMNPAFDAKICWLLYADGRQYAIISQLNIVCFNPVLCKNVSTTV